jgi:hypothetical protein
MDNTGLHLSRWEKSGLVFLALVLVVFGGFVVVRSAFLSQRLGDLGVYLRAAWAVQTGEDIYDITERGRWHYCYPPLLAILLVPLADPPRDAGAGTSGLVPYAVSAGVWYVLNLVFLFLAAHWLASALERAASGSAGTNPPRCSRPWWRLRILPIVACLPPIGHTLMRGQMNLLVLVLVCGMAAAVVRGRRFQAGLWLAGAISIKIIPAFLLVYPLWRRDGRLLAGCLAGLLVGLALIPAAVFGPSQAVAYSRKLVDVMVLPGMGVGTDRSRADELINVTSTDSQSILATLHNTLFLDRATRPKEASTSTRLISLLLGGLLTAATLLAAGRRRSLDGPAMVVFLGMLTLNMLFLSPVCHLHYFCLSLPLVMGLMAAAWHQRQVHQLSKGMSGLLAIYLIANVAPLVPGLEVLRDAGLAMYAGLLLWIAGLFYLWKRPQVAALASVGPAASALQQAA